MQIKLTGPERGLIAGCIGLAGAATWITMGYSQPHSKLTDLTSYQELRIVFAGAALSGYLLGELFLASTGKVICASIFTTILGASFAAGAFALIEMQEPAALLIGAVFGPMAVAGAIVSNPTTAGVWILAMLGVQAMARQVRPESSDCP